MPGKPPRQRKTRRDDPASVIKDPNSPSSLLAKDAPHTSMPGKAQSKTLTWLELPEWQRDNEYILTGYRRYVSTPRLLREK
ncbi:hypothetical protein TRAPUB_1676 [Trametes pubescens]|uniref:Uncharacterized protein n=1 Tax=Trametes pubescens TaxID=154538 RepID=A0A1M2VIR5_TRAPU|nr:hypothetical protein TRAPUB_1676 [Trametes pubescens]